jgi:hypothetical protein
MKGAIIMDLTAEQKHKARVWMKRTLLTEAEEYTDECGETNHTKLAEACAEELDLYVGKLGPSEGLSDDEYYIIPEDVYDTAVDMP